MQKLDFNKLEKKINECSKEELEELKLVIKLKGNINLLEKQFYTLSTSNQINVLSFIIGTIGMEELHSNYEFKKNAKLLSTIYPKVDFLKLVKFYSKDLSEQLLLTEIIKLDIDNYLMVEKDNLIQKQFK